MTQAPALSLGAASRVHRGRVRQNNEDAVLCDASRRLFAVSDGMGGRNSGAVASKIVIDALPPLLDARLASATARTTDDECVIVGDALVELSARMFESAKGVPTLNGMGATVVMALVRESHAIVANMGDSRAYLFRQGSLVQRTEDHSIVGILLREGDITREEAATHPARGKLSRFVGMEGQTRPDVFAVPLRPRDRLLLCSDGLTGMLTDRAIAEILRRRKKRDAACRALVEAALAAGGHDNVAVVVVDVDGKSPRRARPSKP